MKDKVIKNLTIALLIFVGVTLVYFIIATASDGYRIWIQDEIDFAVTGQFGDFVGGFLGTIINGAAFYFLYLTLNEQRKSSLKQSFETKIYDLIHLHRENINELSYTKYHNDKMMTSTSRKVFKDLVQEFIDCYHEVKHFTKMYPHLEVLKADYKNKLAKIRKNNNCNETVETLALIDIAFCFFYFGVSKESETILLHKFYHRYNPLFVHKLKVFIQLKPKKENNELYHEWERFRSLKMEEKIALFENIYPHAGKTNLPDKCEKHVLYRNLKAEKFYGGHQHRLGHYFRHLFQSYKFLSQQDFLNPKEKYFYGKTIRAQLSTYEQFLLFINSLSSMGMKWEYDINIDDLPSKALIDDFKFITRYNLIKNLPGSQYYDFKYRKFYPNVNFEYREDITYAKIISNN